MNIRLQLYKYRCNHNQHEYEATAMPSFSHGKFLLRSEGRRSEAYLNAIEDPVYEEVDRILKKSPKTKGKDDIQLAAILRSVFSIACDPDIDGTFFKIGLPPRCPTCGSDEASYWEAFDPPKFLEKDIPHVTHKKWNTLSEKEKEDLVSSSIPP